MAYILYPCYFHYSDNDKVNLVRKNFPWNSKHDTAALEQWLFQCPVLLSLFKEVFHALFPISVVILISYITGNECDLQMYSAKDCLGYYSLLAFLCLYPLSFLYFSSDIGHNC